MTQCQFNVIGWGIMFICIMIHVLRCAGEFKPLLESGPVKADLTSSFIHSYKLLINDVIDLFTRSLKFLVCCVPLSK